MSGAAPLATLFVECFSPSELRQFLLLLPSGELLLNSLPESMPLNVIMTEAALLLQRHGLVTANTLNAIRKLRPGQLARIEACATALGIRTTETEAAASPSTPLSSATVNPRPPSISIKLSSIQGGVRGVIIAGRDVRQNANDDGKFDESDVDK